MRKTVKRKQIITRNGWLLILIFGLLVGLIGKQSYHLQQNTVMEPVLASTVISTGDFSLSADNRWDAVSKKNYAELSWDEVSDLSQAGYQLFQSEDGTNWTNRSLNYGKAIKVLNVYPDLETSNTLKGWMDGLDLKDSNNNTLIQVTPVAITDFNSNPTSYLTINGEYIYDVIMFGSWDGNNAKDLTAESAQKVQAFVDSGRGVLLGHDTIRTNARSDDGFAIFAPQIGVTYKNEAGGLETPSTKWNASTKVQLISDGYLMKYPFEMQNSQVLEIPISHNLELQYKDVGTVWMEFAQPFSTSSGYSTVIYEDEALRGAWYLKTNNNLAMIQTGHSNGASTEDERKIIANVLYNLAQVSLENSAQDQSVLDNQAPDVPEASIRCGIEGKLNIKVDAVDNGKDYQWYVEANTKSSGTLKSDVVTETILSNTAGYFYEVTDSPTSTLQAAVEAKKDAYGRIAESEYDVYVAPDDDAVDYETATTFTINEIRESGRYLHIVAVDRANNVSMVSTTELDDIVQYVDFEIERTGDEVQLVELKLDASLDGTQKSVEVQIPTNAVIRDFNSLVLPSGWYSFENSETADYRSFTFAMEDNNDLATIQTFLEDLRVTLEAPVNQSGTIRLVFHEKVYTSRVDTDGITHYYTFVRDVENWLDAYNSAKAMTYKGLTGYLATLTSAEEHDFVYDNIAKDFGWLGGTRMVTGSGQKIDDNNKISGNISDYMTDVVNAPQWYWADGPEAGLVFFDKPTYVLGGASPVGVYNGFNNVTNNPGTIRSEPNNGGGSEYVVQFAQANETKYWNDLPQNSLANVAGYYVEFSAYDDQVEGIEITDVCWAAAVPQKVSLKAYDEDGNALSEGDLLYDNVLRIGKEETVTPKELWMYEFIKLTNLDDTVQPLSYTISDTYQEGKLIYANRKVTVHIRQVITDKNDQLIAPEEGYGQLISQGTSGTTGQTFSISMVSSEDNTAAFTDYVLRYEASEPYYTYAPTMPEYYQLTGYALTTSNQQHVPASSTTTPIQVDVSQDSEFWLTIYIQQSNDTPKQYSWDYKLNELGDIQRL